MPVESVYKSWNFPPAPSHVFGMYLQIGCGHVPITRQRSDLVATGLKVLHILTLIDGCGHGRSQHLVGQNALNRGVV